MWPSNDTALDDDNAETSQASAEEKFPNKVEPHGPNVA